MRQIAKACLVLLFLHGQLAYSATGCVQWSVYPNQLSTGALLENDYKTLSACQNYCVQNAECVAVDFSSSSQCWVHTDVDDFAVWNSSTRTGVLNITQYRLNRDCDPRATTPAVTRVCRPTWRVMNNTNALGASESFKVPDVDTCLTECARVPSCVAVDVNVNARPMLCWPHYRAADLADKNIFSQPGTNLHMLTGSCASDCVAQWIRMNDTNAHGATSYFNVSSETQCLDYCMRDVRCVAVDVNHNRKPLRCWPHTDLNAILHDNLYASPGTSLFIPVKRCIASLYWAKTTIASAGTIRPEYATSTTMLQLLLLLMLLLSHQACL